MELLDPRARERGTLGIAVRDPFLAGAGGDEERLLVPEDSSLDSSSIMTSAVAEASSLPSAVSALLSVSVSVDGFQKESVSCKGNRKYELAIEIMKSNERKIE